MNDFYVPVQWLIDETPLHEPLLRWADRWGERDRIERASGVRSTGAYWGSCPAWLYAIAWSVLGLACVLGPAGLFRAGAIYFVRRQLPLALRERAGVSPTASTSGHR